MQIIIVPTTTPENGDPEAQYVNIIKHIYLHKASENVYGCVHSSAQVGLWAAFQGGSIGYELYA